MPKAFFLGEKGNACFRILQVALVFALAILPWAVHGTNLLHNGDFQSLDYWIGPQGESLTQSNCLSANCLSMNPVGLNAGEYQYVVGLSPNGTYEFSAYFNSSLSHNGGIDLWNPDWENGNCVKVGRRIQEIEQGTGQWQRLSLTANIPPLDDCGQMTSNQSWVVDLYGPTIGSENTSILYSNATLAPANTVPQPSYQAIEGPQFRWQASCSSFSPVAPCNSDAIGYGIDPTAPNPASPVLVLKGNRTLTNQYLVKLRVKPSTKYEITAWFRILNRSCYSVLDDGYPPDRAAAPPQGSYGIYCGTPSLELGEPGFGGNSNLLNTQDNSWQYVYDSQTSWTQVHSFYQTTPHATELKLQSTIEAFDGSFLLQGISINEAPSAIEDKYMTIPITYGFPDINVTYDGVGTHVNTASGSFTLTSDTITAAHAGTVVGSVHFNSPVLDGLTLSRKPGLAILSNSRIELSVGADSNIVAKLLASSTLSVSGSKPSYHAFEGGLIFTSDYSQGLLFSPILPPQNVRSASLDDAWYAAAGLKNWNLASPFSSNSWEVDYSFGAGEGFFFSFFPPKEFNETKYCKERISGGYERLNTLPGADYSYVISDLSERTSIDLVDSTNMALAHNTLNPPHSLFENSSNSAQLLPPSLKSPDKVEVPLPYPAFDQSRINAENPEAVRSFVQSSHAFGMKVIEYASPGFAYVSDPEAFVQSIQQEISATGIDGIYYDGLFDYSALKNLALLRLTRNMLRDKYFVEHTSYTRMFTTPDSTDYRVPFFDAYADQLFTGEDIVNVDPDTWRLNYCGENVGNTPSHVIEFTRPSAQSMLPLSVQADNTLACKGQFQVSSGYTMQYYSSFMLTSYYWDKLNTYCLPKTCGDGTCDVGENIFSCPQDCAPITQSAVLSQTGGKFTCTTNGRVAQWIVDGKPLYRLHYAFDSSPVRDVSGNNFHPSPYIVNSVIPLQYPSLMQVDGKSAYYFNGSTMLIVQNDGSLSSGNQSFSVFAKFKPSDKNLRQIIAYLNAYPAFYLGIDKGKVDVEESAPNGTVTNVYGTGNLSEGWNTIGVTYDHSVLTLWLNGDIDSQYNGSYSGFLPLGNFWIGGGTGQPLVGYLGDLFVADHAITDEQARDYADHTLAKISASSPAQCIVEDGISLATASLPNPTAAARGPPIIYNPSPPPTSTTPHPPASQTGGENLTQPNEQPAAGGELAIPVQATIELACPAKSDSTPATILAQFSSEHVSRCVQLTLTVTTPSGKLISLSPAHCIEGDHIFVFTPTEDGGYQLDAHAPTGEHAYCTVSNISKSLQERRLSLQKLLPFLFVILALIAIIFINFASKHEEAPIPKRRATP